MQRAKTLQDVPAHGGRMAKSQGGAGNRLPACITGVLGALFTLLPGCMRLEVVVDPKPLTVKLDLSDDLKHAVTEAVKVAVREFVQESTGAEDPE